MHFEIHVKLVLSKLRCSDQRDQNTSAHLLLHHWGIKLLLMQYMDTITNEKKIGLTEILYLPNTISFRVQSKVQQHQ